MWRGGGVVSGGIGDERGAYHVSLLGGLSAAASLLARVVDFFLCNETVRNCEKNVPLSWTCDGRSGLGSLAAGSRGWRPGSHGHS